MQIQSWWRQRSARLAYVATVALVIRSQAFLRRILAVCRAARMRKSIRCIQQISRKWIASRKVRKLRSDRDFELLRNRCVSIVQAHYRGSASRMRLEILRDKATKIQRHWRRFSAICNLQAALKRILLVQSFIRRLNASKTFAFRRGAILSMQKSARKWIAVRRVRKLRIIYARRQQESAAATKIQSSFRGFQVRQVLYNLNYFAALIQRNYRGHAARVYYFMDIMDIIAIQSMARRFLVRKRFVRMHVRSKQIQAIIRRFVACRRAAILRAVKSRLDTEMKSSLTIQRVWRGHVARLSSRKHAAARKIQKTWRCYNVHVDFMIQFLGIILIQSWTRRFLAKRSFQKCKAATIILQALTRGISQRRRTKNIFATIVCIQSAVRMKLAISNFRRHREAIIAIQKTVRGCLCRIDWEIANFAACEIQRVWRGFSALVDFVLSVMSAIKIQTIVRRQIAKRIHRDRKLAHWAEESFVHRKAVVIQTEYRNYRHRKRVENASSAIQRKVRSFLFWKKLELLTKGVKRLQAFARASFVRRRRSEIVCVIVRKLKRANAKAQDDPRQCLGYRTEAALKVLLHSTRLSEIMAAVTTLETSTRLSTKCCEVFVKAKAVDILLALIRTCNRSLPHVELLHHILLTLDNVARHEPLLVSVANSASSEVFMDLIQMFRDKDGIFCISVSLLNRAIHSDDDVKVRHLV